MVGDAIGLLDDAVAEGRHTCGAGCSVHLAARIGGEGVDDDLPHERRRERDGGRPRPENELLRFERDGGLLDSSEGLSEHERECREIERFAEDGSRLKGAPLFGRQACGSRGHERA